MPRKSRIYSESQMYHVIMRGNNTQILFYDDKDRLYFLTHLRKYAEDLQIDIFSYCLMSNHIHLAIGNATPSVSRFIQKLATSYAMYFNRKYERSGHLFQGRFKSEPIETEKYLKTVIRYILQNPIKAHVCTFQKYKWSSYNETVFFKKNKIVNLNKLYDFFDGKDKYINFINAIDSEVCMEYENKRYLSDLHCISLIKQLVKISPAKLNSLTNKKQLMYSIKIMKTAGMNNSQIIRLTGLPRKLVLNA